MQQQNNNFMDSRTIVAIILVGVVWFGWQTYMQKAYPPAPVTAEAPATNTAATNPTTSSTTTASVNSSAETAKVAEAASEMAENLTEFTGENISFVVSSKGMGLKNIHLNKYKDRNNDLVVLGTKEGALAFSVNFIGHNKDLDFVVQKEGNTFTGTAQYQGMTIKKIYTVNEVDYTLDTQIKVENANDKFLGLSVIVAEPRLPHTGGSFLTPNYDQQDFVVDHGGKVERVSINRSTNPIQQSFSQVGLVSISTHYFATAILDKSQISPEISVVSSPDQANAVAQMNYKPVNQVNSLDLNMKVYAGPKSLTILQQVDPQMAEIINFGMFSMLAKPMLSVMKWFYTFVGNWGFAVILLTLLVRLVVMPFNIMSYRSMKEMQKIQPLLQSLREKYKNDPQTMNKETMALMKQHKVNPIGGCLPMLLQMPVLFALYQVFGQSIELYQQPFILWIHDLSLKDPFFVLPVLMGITMFIQQKITPTNMDPAQAKVMMFMPVVFSFMMISLPSGLTLYIFVSTLFGILQQLYFVKDRKKTALAAKEVKA